MKCYTLTQLECERHGAVRVGGSCPARGKRGQQRASRAVGDEAFKDPILRKQLIGAVGMWIQKPNVQEHATLQRQRREGWGIPVTHVVVWTAVRTRAYGLT